MDHPIILYSLSVPSDTLLQKSKICNDFMDMIISYADDITVIVDGNEKVNEIRHIFELFEAVSSARLNLTKTVDMQIAGFPVPTWLNIKTEIKILGIFFEENLKSSASKSWNDTINKARGLLFIHMGRDLNIIQRVIFCNTFELSKICCKLSNNKPANRENNQHRWNV
jgi:hypothetical protein